MLRLPKFLKRFIRRSMRPVAQADALATRTKLSLVYAFFAWHAFGIGAYLLFVKQIEHQEQTGLSDGRYFAQILKKENVHLYRVRNTKVVGQWDLEEEKRQHGRLLTIEELARQERLQQEDQQLPQQERQDAGAAELGTPA